MTPTQALREARKMFGPNASVTMRPRPSSPESRAAGLAECRALREVPKADRDKAWDAAIMKATSRACYYRCYIGRIELGLFNSVKGMGDNLDEAIEAARREHSPSKVTA